jgi:hypothetical protein
MVSGVICGAYQSLLASVNIIDSLLKKLVGWDKRIVHRHDRNTMPTSIKLSFGNGTYESPNDYGDLYIQGGVSGLVITNDPDNPTYTTAFIEVFPEGSFIRGEGATLEDADADCWKKFNALSECGEHEYEPRGYTNGAGFCKKCRQFFGGVFTGEQLGQLCDTCGVGCLSHRMKDTGKWFCDEHYPLQAYSDLMIKKLRARHIWRKDKSDDIDYYETGSYEFAAMSQQVREIVYQKQAPDPAVLEYFDQFEIVDRSAPE